jgi:chemotaxis signal transduction protein
MSDKELETAIYPVGPVQEQTDTDDSGETLTRDLLVARCGNVKFGLFADLVDAITEWKQTIPLPDSPGAVLGVTSSRGRMLTLLDPLELLNEAPIGSAARDFVIALSGDEQLGLAVDQVERIVEIGLEEFALTGSEPDPIHGLIKFNGETLRVLDTTRLFQAAIRGLDRRRQRFQ